MRCWRNGRRSWRQSCGAAVMDDVDDTDRKAARLIASGRAFAEVAEAYGGKPAYWRTVVKSSASFKALLDECRRRIDDEFRAAATKACEVPVIDRRRYPRAPAPE